MDITLEREDFKNHLISLLTGWTPGDSRIRAIVESDPRHQRHVKTLMAIMSKLETLPSDHPSLDKLRLQSDETAASAEVAKAAAWALGEFIENYGYDAPASCDPIDFLEGLWEAINEAASRPVGLLRDS